MHDYSEFQEAPTESGFDKLDALVREQVQAEEEVAEAEAALKQAQQRYRDVAERQLPELMDEMGLAEFTTRDGFKISIKEELRHSLSRDRKAAALRWLEEHQHGDIIKRAVQVRFGQGEEDAVKRLMDALGELDMSDRAEMDRSVHASTLKALLKQLLDEGVEVPLETFGAFRQRTAKIKSK